MSELSRHDPILGRLERTRWRTWQSEPKPWRALPGSEFPIELHEDWPDGPAPSDLTSAAVAFLSLEPSSLKTPAILAALNENYDENRSFFCPDSLPVVNPADLWEKVTPIGATVRRDRKSGQPHVVVECNCEWEPEHGLALVFADGVRCTRLSQYDDHLTGPGEL